MNLNTTFFFLTLFFFSIGLWSFNSKESKNVSAVFIDSINDVYNPGINSSSHYIINDLPIGFVRDGSRDYTSYVQAAVTKYNNIVFPGFPILVNDTGIIIKSDKTITFQKGSEIRLKPSSKKGYNILKILNANNVTLYNPVIVGDRYTHIGSGGEWGMGIGILGSSNVTIYGPKISNCWGDGIYIGLFYNRIICKNIVIKDAHLRKNRRDGISIIAVDGLLLDNIYAGYTDGTKPMTGINFEPDNPKCELKNILIKDALTEYNGSRGIQVAPRHMLADIDKISDITIVNHIDRGSPDNAFKMGCKTADGVTAKLKGNINIINPVWHGTLNNVPLNLSSNQTEYTTFISSPKVITTSAKLLSYSDVYTLLMEQKARANLILTNKLKTKIHVWSPSQ